VTAAFIEVEKLTKRYGVSTVVDRVSFAAQEGELLTFLGPSGCGKTTTLRCIGGFNTPDGGAIRIGGADMRTVPPHRRQLGMVFQNYALFPHLSVADNISFGLSVRKVPAAETAARLAEAAQLLGLTQLLDRKPSQLSGGQQQRVALARALVARAKVCLMDEPLSNLDAQLRQEMRTELRQLQQRLGLTVVYVTHDQAEAMSMADQVVLLYRGRIEQAATPRELYARPATTFAAAFIGTPSMNLLRLDGSHIAGSRVPAGRAAHWLGVRPESVSLGGQIPATVRSVEYLGADLILHCGVGSETLTVRTGGQAVLSAGSEVLLDWHESATHHFDSQGQRLQ